MRARTRLSRAGRVVLIAAILVSTTAGGVARAARAAVLPLKHEEGNKVVALAISGALRRALQQQQLQTIDAEVVRRLQEVIPDSCTSRKCMDRIAELVDAQLLVSGRLDRDPEATDSWILHLWLYDRRKQANDDSLRVATTQDRCDGCQLAELSQLAERLMASLLDKAAALGDSAQLTVRSTPKGAVVRIDGTPMGVTDMTFGLTPGSHLVTLHKAGYRVSSHRVRLAQRDRRELSSMLVPMSSTADAPPRAYRWLKWTLAGTAVAALGVGIGLWAKGRVASSSGPGVEPEITNYRTPGIVLTAVGGALAGGAVALFILDRPRRPKQRHSASPVALVTSDGALVGYQGAF